MGAPAEVVARLAAVRQEFEARQQRDSAGCRQTSKDPELDQFMVFIMLHDHYFLFILGFSFISSLILKLLGCC